MNSEKSFRRVQRRFLPLWHCYRAGGACRRPYIQERCCQPPHNRPFGPLSSGMTATGSHIHFYSLRGAQPPGEGIPLKTGPLPSRGRLFFARWEIFSHSKQQGRLHTFGGNIPAVFIPDRIRDSLLSIGSFPQCRSQVRRYR